MTDELDEPRTHHVLVSRELLPELRVWSEPVQVRIAHENGKELVLEIRRVAVLSPEVSENTAEYEGDADTTAPLGSVSRNPTSE